VGHIPYLFTGCLGDRLARLADSRLVLSHRSLSAAMIVLKISCNGEIHRIQLDGTADYQFVCQSVQDLFPSSAIQGIKYVDEEGDLCTLVDATFTDFLQTAQEGGYERKMLKVQVTCMPRALGWQKGQHMTRLADDDRWICAKCDEPNCAEREMCNNCGVTKVAAQADKLIGVWGFGSSGKRRVYEIKAFGGALVLQQKNSVTWQCPRCATCRQEGRRTCCRGGRR